MATVHVEGLSDFRREIKKVDSEYGKALRQVHVDIADLITNKAQAAAPTRLRRAMRPKATQAFAAVQITDKPADALAQIFGSKRRTGWYAARRYRGSSRRQFKAWVGNQWEPGAASGKPYFVGDAINSSIDEVIEIYGDAIEQLASKAFPDTA